MPDRQTQRFTEAMQAAPGQMPSLLRLPHLDYLLQISWFRLAAPPAPVRPVEVTTEGSASPQQLWRLSVMGSLISNSLSKKIAAAPAASMRASEERLKRPKAPLPASMPCKATDCLAFKLFKSF